MSANGDLVYMAEPIDFGAAEHNLVQFATGYLSAADLTIYRPADAFVVGSTPSGVVNRVNHAAMTAATGAVAFLPGNVKSVGVPSEIGYLQARYVPLLVVTTPDMELSSWVVAGWADSDNIKVVAMAEDAIQAGVEWLIGQMELVNSVRQSVPDPIIFERTRDDAKLPSRGYSTDAGYDLASVEQVYVPARGRAMIPTGVKVDLPPGSYGQITGRSSSFDLGLIVAPGVGIIDEEYTGELYIPVWNMTGNDVMVDPGQRVGQLILHQALGQDFAPTWGKVPTKQRGSNGFGSTGR